MKNFQIIQILMLVVFFLGMGSQALSTPQGLAQDAYTIFEQNCFSCHGPEGIYKVVLLIEHSALIKEGGPVVPGDPDASRLYKRIRGEGGATDATRRSPSLRAGDGND